MTRIFMRSPPARRAAVVALASASSPVVCATALAKAGAASIVLFITFPPLSRPGKRQRRRKPQPSCIGLCDETLEPIHHVRGPRRGGAAERGGTRRRTGRRAPRRNGARAFGRRPLGTAHRRMTQTHAPPSEPRALRGERD